MLTLSFYIIAIVKLYILLAFLPALSLWLLLTYSHKIKVVGVRWLVNFLFAGITIAGFSVLTQRFAAEMNTYSLEKVANTSASTRGWIAFASGDEGSAYDLGEFEPTIEGMLSKFPAAVVVTLYRPFIWEAKKIIVALSAIEALIFLFFTAKVFYKKGLGLFKTISQDPNLIFLLIFSLIFAFAVGISSYNFGALSRYKIPCLPFYAAFIVIVMYNRPANNTQVKSAKKAVALA
jgi:hypothetical protein